MKTQVRASGRRLVVASALWLAACSQATVPPPLQPPHAGVQVQMRVVDADGQGAFQWQGGRLALREPPLVTSADITDVTAVLEPAYPALNFRFRPEAAARLQHATAALVGKQVAVTVDDHVLTVATVQGAFGDAMQVRSGDATVADVQDMARYITEGGTPPQAR